MEINEANEEKKAPEEPKKRKVTLSTDVKVIFKSEEEGEVKIVGRDVFSVMDTITARLADTKSREEMEAIRVSVHSFENPEKSDPLPDGEQRWEGIYGVGNVEIEDLSIPDAMGVLSKAVLPADYAMLAFEQVAAQCFTRSRMDGALVVATFDGVPSVTPLVNTMKEQRKENIVSMYRTLLKAADGFRRASCERFKTLGLKDSDFDEDVKVDSEKDAEERARKLVLPSGLPASMAQRGVVTPEEARKDQVRVIGLT